MRFLARLLKQFKMKKKRIYILNSFSVISGEMIDGKGEDCYSYKYKDKKGFIGVFDGCGGIGGKRYERFHFHTGAYLASRVAALATLEWWSQYNTSELSIVPLKEKISEKMQILKKLGESFQGQISLKGSLSSKSFPTTASIITYDFFEKPSCTFVWAGDSRGYILDKDGLCQVTKDDIDSDGDAYSNIEGDARLSNIICADKDFSLHEKKISLFSPCVLISSTDGCFSYFQTPMEFEYLLLSTLMSSHSIYEWEIAIKKNLHRQASDDYTMTVLICGFRKLKEIKQYFRNRFQQLKNNYINPIFSARKTNSDIDIDMLWKEYRGLYYRYE